MIGQKWQWRIARADYTHNWLNGVNREWNSGADWLYRRWNDALEALKTRKEQYAQFLSQEVGIVSDEQREMVLELANDLPRLCDPKTNSPKDKKRMLTLLIKDITVEIMSEEQRAILHMRWQGGANDV